ncbi:MAG: hypothetical protein MUE87_03150 [Methanothrix sp.]|nr:hypothetical protein [Methanothrix sp.]
MKIKSIICLALILAVLTSPAWAGCGRWVVRETTDYLDDPIFSEAMAPSASSAVGNSTESSEDSRGRNETEENSTAAPLVERAAVQSEVPGIDLAGKWMLRMAGEHDEQGAGKIMEIILIQTADRLQGYGTLLDEDTEIPATATGSISQDDINLDIKLTEQKENYRLSLTLVGSQLEGSYQLYDMQKLSESGNATATRSGS